MRNNTCQIKLFSSKAPCWSKWNACKISFYWCPFFLHRICRLILVLFTTRGLKGSWVAHNRKRSMVTLTEDPRGIIWKQLGRGPLYSFTKYERSGPFCFRQEDVWKWHLKHILWARDLLMHPIRTIWTISCRRSRTIPVEFGQIPISGSRE